MATKDWIIKNLPELNPAQVTMLERFIEDRERRLLIALAWMYDQYCGDNFGHHFMGAGEEMKRDTNEIAYMISGKIVRRGFRKVVEISMTDGVDVWTTESSGSFTVNELKRRFPFFHKLNKEKK